MTGGFGGSMGGVTGLGGGGGGKGKRPISVKFEIPYFTTSGIQVRYLKIIEPKVRGFAFSLSSLFSLFSFFFLFLGLDHLSPRFLRSGFFLFFYLLSCAHGPVWLFKFPFFGSVRFFGKGFFFPQYFGAFWVLAPPRCVQSIVDWFTEKRARTAEKGGSSKKTGVAQATRVASSQIRSMQVILLGSLPDAAPQKETPKFFALKKKNRSLSQV